jgi:hypothetical protein
MGVNFPSMQVVKQSFADCPEQVVFEPFDLVWIRCHGMQADAPFTSHALQWIDWNLQGQITRWWHQKPSARMSTFIPTFQKTGSPMIALDVTGELSVPAMVEACRGLNAKQVLVLCRDAAEVGAVEKEVRHHKTAGFPERIVVGSDEAVGRS